MSKTLDYAKVRDHLTDGDPAEDDWIVTYDQTTERVQRSDVGEVITAQHPSHVRWTDLRAPATAINPPGQVNDADIDVDGGLLFASNAVEQIAVIMQMPHEWKEGSEILPHVHWSKTTDAAGGVEWEYRYRVFNVGDLIPAWSSWLASDGGSPDPGATQAHRISGFPDIDMTGFTLSAMISVQVRRNGDATDDTYAADAKLWEFDIHYQIDSLGSEQEYIK